MRRILVVALWIAAVSFAQDIKVTSGPVAEQVLQRNADQTAEISLTGTIAGKKVEKKNIEARLEGSDGSPLAGFDWTAIGKVQKATWSGSLRGVPTGGPYRLDIRMQGGDSVVSIPNLLVGDLWVLAGQSNMEGHGDLVEVQQPSPFIHSFDMSDRWLVAEEPLHTQVSAVDPVHWSLNADKQPERMTGEKLESYLTNRKKGTGLGLPFAIDMLARTNVPIGLIPCAHGGTSMSQWSPSLKDREGESLYGSMYRRVQAVGGHVKGMLWYQGESDANAKDAPLFLQRFEDFVKAVREDFKQPDLPFYYVQIGRHISKTNVQEWNQVQLAQLRAESEIPHSGMVAAVDLQLDDGIHVGTQDLKRLGKRLAEQVCRDLFPTAKDYGSLKAGPHPVQAVYRDGVVKVTFSGVNGRLQSDGRIAGFSIHDAGGAVTPMIYKSRVDSAEASSVLLYVQGRLPESATLWYGFGKDPYCNLRDAADMAVPVFQVKIGN